MDAAFFVARGKMMPVFWGSHPRNMPGKTPISNKQKEDATPENVGGKHLKQKFGDVSVTI